MSPLFNIWHSIQHTLFPWLEEELDPLTEKQQEFVRVIELAEVQKHMSPYRWQGIGRKRDDRLAIVNAFVAKAVYNFPTTKALIAYLHDSTNLRRLCGWESKREIPSESTFSRVFEEFSRGGLGQKIHEAMVKQHAGPKLAGHVSRDATAIEAREKPFRKEPKAPGSEPKRKRGRPRQGEVRTVEGTEAIGLAAWTQFDTERGRFANAVRCRYEDQCQGVQNKLDRLQTASRFDRWGHPGKCGPEFGFAA